MGFFNSFKSQVGRDTGKVVSNLVWGDKHASVYRRAQSRYQANKQNEAETEALERLVQEQKIDKAKESVQEGVAKVIAMKVPQSKELLIDMLQDLTVMIIANPWKSTIKEENIITNKYSDALFQKYEQVLFSLKTRFLNDQEITYFEKQHLEFAKAKRKGKFSEIIIFSIIGIALFVFLGIMSYIEKSEKESKANHFEKIETIS